MATRREFLKSSGGALIASALAKLGFDADEVLAQGEAVEPDGEPLYRINPNAQYAEYAGYGTGMYSVTVYSTDMLAGDAVVDVSAHMRDAINRNHQEWIDQEFYGRQD